MMTDDPLARLQQWYRAHCDGDWEHARRVRIGTLDNPGWSLSVNLEDSDHSQLAMDRIDVERSPTDWYSCWLEGGVFHGAGGAGNLGDLITTFLEWTTPSQAVGAE
jgi:hypothetical protein